MKREFEVSVAVPKGKDVKNFTRDFVDIVIVGQEVSWVYKYLEENRLIQPYDSKILIKLVDGEQEGPYIVVTIENTVRELQLPYPNN